MGALAWIGTSTALTAAFLCPAILNGFPIIFHDTGGYLWAAAEGELFHGRAAIYGAFLALGIAWHFWPVIVVQAALAAWLLALVFRMHGLGGRPLLVLLVGLGLAALTALPWYTAQLMPDIWLPAGIVSLYALACRPARLRRWEKLLLGAVVVFATASHAATMALLLGLVAAFALLKAVAPRLALPRPRLAGPALAILLGVLAAPVSNLAITGAFTFTPGGMNILFGRLVETGLAARYLDDNCPDPTIRLCAFRDQLPARGNDWLWGDSPLHELGGWEAFEDEARRVLLATLVDYPFDHLRAAVSGALVQFVMVASGDGMTPATGHVGWVMETMAPAPVAAAFDAARQQQRGYDFRIYNLVHVPVALLAALLLPLVAWLGCRRLVRPSVGLFAAVVLLSLVGNAVICGALANPHHRYQSRMVFLAPLAVAMAALTLRRRALQAGRANAEDTPGAVEVEAAGEASRGSAESATVPTRAGG